MSPTSSSRIVSPLVFMLVLGPLVACCAQTGGTFAFQSPSTLNGMLRLDLTAEPASVAPEGTCEVSLTGTSMDQDWPAARLTIDLPPGWIGVSGNLGWTGPLRRGQTQTVQARIRFAGSGPARLRGAGSCNSPTDSGSHSWSGTAFLVLNRDLIQQPRIVQLPAKPVPLPLVLAKCRFTRAQLLAQQGAEELSLPLDIPDRVTVSAVKASFWEQFDRPEVHAFFRSTYQGKTVQSGLYAGDVSLPSALHEERLPDGSYYARGLAITAFGWNLDLLDLEWIEFTAYEHREAPTIPGTPKKRKTIPLQVHLKGDVE